MVKDTKSAKRKPEKAIVGILLPLSERKALKELAGKNCRKLTDQIRLYIREGLTRDGYTME